MDQDNPMLESDSATPRVLRELIRSPVFKEILKLHLTDIDPRTARDTVRVMMWEDVELTLSLMGTAPQVINSAVDIILEMGKQLKNYPPELLRLFIAQASEAVDSERIIEIPAVYGPLLDSIFWEDPEFRGRISDSLSNRVNDIVDGATRLISRMDEAMSEVKAPERETGIDPEGIGRLITAGARLVHHTAERNPYFLRDVARNVEMTDILAAGLSVLKCMGRAVISLVSSLFDSLVRGPARK